MRRREFISGFVAGAVWPRTSDAQQPKQLAPKPAVVGGLWQGSSSAPTVLAAREAFEQGLREEGYVEGQNMVIHSRYQEESEGLKKAAAELVALTQESVI